MYQISRPKLQPGIILEENVRVTMRDGVKIAMDVYRPENPGKYPAIMSTSPYFKEIQLQPPILSHSIEAGATQFFVSHGYVHVIVQVRGSGLSQGCYNWYDDTEQQDGYELIEWIAQQPWCTGSIGMMGDSYFGRSQYLIAGKQPPHLKCIVPFDAGMDDYRDSRNAGGIIRSGWIGMWGADTMFQCLWGGEVEGKQPPVNIFTERFLHPEDGPYYWERSGWTKIDKINVPALFLAEQQSATHSRGQLWGFPKIKSPKKMYVLPPAGHLTNVMWIQSKPVNELVLKWFDYWLKGVKNDVMDGPQVSICDEVTREWRYENEYPLKRTEWTKYYVRTNPSGKASDPPYGLLSTEKPGKEEPDKIIMPDAMRPLYANKPVLGYATPSLEKDLKVWGPLSVTLFGSTTARDSAWFIKLGDIDPDGKTDIITNGLLKASYRKVDEKLSTPGQPFVTFQKPELPESGKIYEFPIELTPIFHTFKKGHKIWIQVADDDIEHHTRLHTIFTAETLPMPSTNNVYHEEAYPSHLLLPVIPDAPEIKPVDPAIAKITWPIAKEDILPV
jgi:predicted acyl esterase